MALCEIEVPKADVKWGWEETIVVGFWGETQEPREDPHVLDSDKGRFIWNWFLPFCRTGGSLEMDP